MSIYNFMSHGCGCVIASNRNRQVKQKSDYWTALYISLQLKSSSTIEEYLFSTLSMNIAKQLIADSTFISEQPKKRRRCHEACKEHLFSLAATEKQKHNLDTVINFCPKIPRGSQPAQSTYPQFNQDQLYYTSAFVLGVDKRILEQTRNEQLLQHNRFVKQTCEKNCKVFFPKPNPKHTVCSVCKVNYGDLYYAHIISDRHKEQIKKSSYNNYLLQLTDLFAEKHPQEKDNLSSPFLFPDVIQKRQPEQPNLGNQTNRPQNKNVPEEDKVRKGKKSTKLEQSKGPWLYPRKTVNQTFEKNQLNFVSKKIHLNIFAQKVFQKSSEQKQKNVQNLFQKTSKSVNLQPEKASNCSLVHRAINVSINGRNRYQEMSSHRQFISEGEWVQLELNSIEQQKIQQQARMLDLLSKTQQIVCEQPPNIKPQENKFEAFKSKAIQQLRINLKQRARKSEATQVTKLVPRCVEAHSPKNEEIARSTCGSETNLSNPQPSKTEPVIINLEAEENSHSNQARNICLDKYITIDEPPPQPKRQMKFDHPGEDISWKKLVTSEGIVLKKIGQLPIDLESDNDYSNSTFRSVRNNQPQRKEVSPNTHKNQPKKQKTGGIVKYLMRKEQRKIENKTRGELFTPIRQKELYR